MYFHLFLVPSAGMLPEYNLMTMCHPIVNFQSRILFLHKYQTDAGKNGTFLG